MKKKIRLSAMVTTTVLFWLGAAGEPYAECMPTNSIQVIGPGFNLWQGGPYLEIAISHGILEGIALDNIIASSICAPIPPPWGLACIATAAAESMWFVAVDQGFGVFADFYFLWGGWVPTAADSLCPSAVQTTGTTGSGSASKCVIVTCPLGFGETTQLCLPPGALCPNSSRCPPGQKLIQVGSDSAAPRLCVTPPICTGGTCK